VTVETTEAMLRGVLARDAARLTAGRPVPIDVAALLGEFAIGLESTVAVGHRGDGHLRRTEAGWRIGVNPTSAVSRQRFTVAHELGHYIVAARVGYRPGSRREYWMLEGACQAFAAELLSPPAVVSAALTPAPIDVPAIRRAVDQLATATDLSLEAAARRIVETIELPVLVAGIDGRAPWDERRWSTSVAWLHQNRSWREIRRGQRIRRGHALAEAGRTVVRLAIGDDDEVFLPEVIDARVERRGPAFGMLVAILSA
jgi:Zn-dependent peptidase ImmA (M78 family)